MAKREDKFIAELEKLVKDAEGNKPCRLCVAVKELTPEGQVALHKVLAMRDHRGRAMFSPRKLYPILRAAGMNVSHAAIGVHQQEGHK